MRNERYSVSFTTGSLFHIESVKLAVLFSELNDWNLVRNKVISENLLQARTKNTLMRVCREIVSRLKMLSSHEIDLLIQGNSQEQAYLLWIAICRRYKFIADFAIEVIRERYLSLKTDLHYEDFDAFFNRKSEWHPELDEIKSSTRRKLRQVLFKILREAELLTANNIINAATPSLKLMKAISLYNPQSFLFFPIFESDLKGFRE